MSSVVHQDPKAQPVQEGQGEAVQGAIPRGDDALDGGVKTSNEKEDHGGRDEADFEVRFKAGDTTNPKEWSSWRRAWALFCIAFSSFIVSLYSTIYTSSIPGVSKAFDIHLPVIPTLGITTYLIGTGAGSLIQAPLSEVFGRRPIYLVSMVVFTLLILPCSLATSIAEILVIRFFGGVFGAATISNAPGSLVDIYPPDKLAVGFSLWSIAPFNGPVIGPIIGGFVYAGLGWRWDNWLTMILSGASVLLMATIPETYAPVLLRKRAARLRKEQDFRYWSRYDDKTSFWSQLKVNLRRPFTLAATEPILWFFNTWVSVVYAVLYLSFVAYPIVFQDYRGWGPGISGLAYLGNGLGVMLAICLEPLWRRIINSSPINPETGRVYPEAAGSIMSLGAICTPIGQLVFAWTCVPASIHWLVPIAFGVPFGFGNTLCFIYSSNYLAGSYGIYAASALSSNTVFRSILGGTLPLAGPKMYQNLTPHWAGTLLGLIELCLAPIPFIFWRYGKRIRSRSRTILQIQKDAEAERRRTSRS
ncbi:major facilitator superfamily domain-containing protein [Aspergillus leporis]|uniref:Major facilitator superfamily domain-containing protein n=1 Tax=Aspergillus leporis TaxID=41062 RepID=A0A5N5XAB5_9EURO|nr:major facilitator superfamily domain-containing protein [Aspergillus leporis]